MNSKMMELHLGILAQKLARIKGKMNVAFAKSEIEKPEDKGIDVESEKLRFQQFNAEYEKLESEISDYEDKVLELTKL